MELEAQVEDLQEASQNIAAGMYLTRLKLLIFKACWTKMTPNANSGKLFFRCQQKFIQGYWEKYHAFSLIVQ